MKHFGKRFSELLLTSGITQKRIAELMQTSHVTVTRWKEVESVDALILERLCRIFRVSVVDFFDSDVVRLPIQKTETFGSQYSDEMMQKEIEYLQRLVDEKERTIQILQTLLKR